MTVEEDGVKREPGFRRCFDEGVEEEGVWIGDGEEEEARVGDGACGAGQGEKLRDQGSAAVEAGDDHVGMDLLERTDTGAGL